MKSGSSMIFINSKNQILLLLRDDIPTIPYPNMWDIPGGHIDPFESPLDCIAREMNEELELILKLEKISKFKVTQFDDRIEHTFWYPIDFNVKDINLHEGQKIQWFSISEIKQMEIAWGLKPIILQFFTAKPKRLETT